MAGLAFWDEPAAGAVDAGGDPILYGTGPTFAPNAWDVVFLGGDPLPGIAEVDGSPKIQFDKKKPPGADGLTVTGQGYLPGPVDIELTLWTQEQWDFFQAMAGKIWVTPNKGQPVKALDISHPAFDLWKVNKVIVESVSVPKRGKIPGSISIKIRCVQFLPPGAKNRTSTPRSTENAPLDGKVDFAKNKAKNAGGDPPSKDSMGPRGPKPDRTAGST